jgi:hypothetical protein
MIWTNARRLPAVVPHSMVLRYGSEVQLPREPRSDDLTDAAVLSDVQNAGTRTILRARPEPTVAGSLDVSKQPLSECHAPSGTNASRPAAQQPAQRIRNRLFRKRPFADFTDSLSAHHEWG